MLVILDYSNTIFRTDLEVTAGSPNDGKDRSAWGDTAEEQAVNIVASETTPSLVDYSRKHATVYLFHNIHSGSYTFKLHQSFKKGRGGCQSAINLKIKTWEAGKSDNHLQKGGILGE
jgi:hypothetical protein